MTASVTDNMEEDEKYRAQDALNELGKSHYLPYGDDPADPVKMRAGEYSINRLFASVSSWFPLSSSIFI